MSTSVRLCEEVCKTLFIQGEQNKTGLENIYKTDVELTLDNENDRRTVYNRKCWKW